MKNGVRETERENLSSENGVGRSGGGCLMLSLLWPLGVAALGFRVWARAPGRQDHWTSRPDDQSADRQRIRIGINKCMKVLVEY